MKQLAKNIIWWVVIAWTMSWCAWLTQWLDWFKQDLWLKKSYDKKDDKKEIKEKSDKCIVDYVISDTKKEYEYFIKKDEKCSDKKKWLYGFIKSEMIKSINKWEKFNSDPVVIELVSKKEDWSKELLDEKEFNNLKNASNLSWIKEICNENLFQETISKIFESANIIFDKKNELDAEKLKESDDPDFQDYMKKKINNNKAEYWKNKK